MKDIRDAIIILAKYPRPEYSKTRLIQKLGGIVAARIAELFLVDILRRFMETQFRIVITGALIDTEGEFQSLLDRYSIPQDRIEIFLPKTGSMMGDIAMSYIYALRESKKVVLTAIDMPHLTVGMVDNILKNLDDHDVVFHPTIDGDACPQGMKKFANLFSDLPSTLLSQWLPRIKSLGLKYKMLEPIFDIDQFEDLKMFYDWQIFLEDSKRFDVFCPETMTFLKHIFATNKN